MSRDQHRRLNAVAAALVPCLGCLDEDLHDVNTELGRLEPEYLAEWRGICDGVGEQDGKPPHPPETEDEAEELEQQRAAVRAARNQLAELRTMSAKGGVSARRKACPNCLNRKEKRETIWILAQNLQAELRRDPEQYIIDNPITD